MKKEKVGAIWIKTISGKSALSITIGDKKFIAWPNDYKKEDKHPDYVIYEDNWKPQQPVNRQEDEDMGNDQLPF